MSESAWRRGLHKDVSRGNCVSLMGAGHEAVLPQLQSLQDGRYPCHLHNVDRRMVVLKVQDTS